MKVQADADQVEDALEPGLAFGLVTGPIHSQTLLLTVMEVRSRHRPVIDQRPVARSEVAKADSEGCDGQFAVPTGAGWISRYRRVVGEAAEDMRPDGKVLSKPRLRTRVEERGCHGFAGL